MSVIWDMILQVSECAAAAMCAAKYYTILHKLDKEPHLTGGLGPCFLIPRGAYFHDGSPILPVL